MSRKVYLWILTTNLRPSRESGATPILCSGGEGVKAVAALAFYTYMWIFFYLMISSRTRNQNSYCMCTIMWIYVDINTWCVVFHIDEHVMCGLSYWWTRACVSLALCCNFLYSSCFFKKWNLKVFKIDILNLIQYKMTYFYYLWVIFLYRSRIKFYG